MVVRVWRVALATAVLAIYFAAGPFGYAAFALLHLIPSRDPVARARMLQGVMRRAFVLLHGTMRLIGLMDFRPRAMAGTLPAGPCVLVANHPSLIDVTAIMASFADITTAVKPQIFRRWWIRPLLEDSAQFEGASSGGMDVDRVIEAGIDRLNRGFRVLIFPEGTRSPPGELRPFGRTAFEIACRAGVPIVPILIRCVPPWLTQGRSLLHLPAETPRYRLQALNSLDPTEYGRASRRLRDVIYDRVGGELAV